MDHLDSLFIKQAELFNFIKERKLVNFQLIRRNFLGIKERTLRYHLKRLADKGLIFKRGSTKGVYYQATPV